jgi:hypothetical protein
MNKGFADLKRLSHRVQSGSLTPYLLVLSPLGCLIALRLVWFRLEAFAHFPAHSTLFICALSLDARTLLFAMACDSVRFPSRRICSSTAHSEVLSIVSFTSFRSKGES